MSCLQQHMTTAGAQNIFKVSALIKNHFLFIVVVTVDYLSMQAGVLASPD